MLIRMHCSINCIINCIGSYFKEAKFRKPTLSECPLSCQEMMYKSVGYQSKVYTRAEVSIVYQHKLGHITEVEELATYELEEFFSDLGSWFGTFGGYVVFVACRNRCFCVHGHYEALNGE